LLAFENERFWRLLDIILSFSFHYMEGSCFLFFKDTVYHFKFYEQNINSRVLLFGLIKLL
jgi:hypothetical protein